ncbi:uncharacterized protein LOC143578130 [Bidens hawaiensis]|uniref:uncharacterized protein LOC143578130 n=1 Tax=Bidens hawaiensis TaxID=980011 RepID=UPI0040496915
MGAERVKDARLHTLIREFDGLMMKETETIDEYASRITAISSKATTLGQPYEERKLVQKFFTSLPSRFIQVVASLEQVLDLKTVGFEDVVGRLKTYEERIKGYVLRSEEGRFHANRVGVAGKVHTEDVVVDVAIRTMVHKEGPMKGIYERCPERRKDKQANLADAKEKDLSLYMVQCVQEEVYLNEQKVIPKDYESGSDEQELWYLDNGASNHMTGNVSFFYELNKRVSGNVKFRDGSYVDICGKGSILLVGKTGEQQLLTDIYYIPSLQINIISLGQATESGCDIRMKDDYLLMYDDQGELLMGLLDPRIVFI